MSEVIHHHIHYVDPILLKDGFKLDLVSAAQQANIQYNEEKSGHVNVPKNVLEGAWIRNLSVKPLNKRDRDVNIINGLS